MWAQSAVPQAGSWYGQDIMPSSPCVVKNTFLHVVSEGHLDTNETPTGSSRRQKSEPPKLRHPEADYYMDEEGHYQRVSSGFAPGFWEDSAAGTVDGEDSDDVEAMNKVNLALCSDCDWLRQTSSVSTRQTSTRQVSGFSQDYSFTSADRSDQQDFGYASDDEGLKAPGCPPLPSASLIGGDREAAGAAAADTGSTPDSCSASGQAAVLSGDGRERPPQDGTGGILGDAYAQAHAGLPGKAAKTDRRQRSRLDPMSWDEGVVTVMVRQIPRQFTQLMFLKEVNRRGFEGLYDFLYLPFDLKKGINVGYGFLSFTDPKHAQDFRAELDGAFLDKQMRMKGKPLRIHPAKMQGYEANFQHFVQTKTGQKQDPHFSPLFFPAGGRAGMQEAAMAPSLQEQEDPAAWAAAKPQHDAGAADQRSCMTSSCSSGLANHSDPGQTASASPPGQWFLSPEQQAASQGSMQRWCFPGGMERQGQMSDYCGTQAQNQQMPTGQRTGTCHACGQEHLYEHNFCACCGARVSNRAVSRSGYSSGGACEDSAKLYLDLEAERRRLSMELDAQPKDHAEMDRERQTAMQQACAQQRPHANYQDVHAAPSMSLAGPGNMVSARVEGEIYL